MAGKIEKWKLQEQILGLAAGGSSARQIAEEMTRQGFPLHESTVARFLTEARKNGAEETQRIVNKHLREHLPKDLEALELMEAILLSWAEEDVDGFARETAAQGRVEDQVEEWAELFGKAWDPEEKKNVLRDIMQKIAALTRPVRDQRKGRIDAMKEVRSIIDTKLKYSGVLGGAAQGEIRIYPAGRPDKEADGEGTGKKEPARIFRIAGED